MLQPQIKHLHCYLLFDELFHIFSYTHLDLSENILQNVDIFTAKEIIKMQISYHSLRRDYSQNR